MAVTHGSHSELLELGIEEIFGHLYERQPQDWKKLYREVNSKKAWAEFLSMSGLTLLSQRDMLEETAQEDPTQGYVVQLRALAYAKSMGIAQEMLEDDLYGIASDFSKMLNDSVAETENVLAYQPFNNGFTATGYDSVALFSASHPQLNGGVYSNLVTAADLSLLLLEAYHIAIDNATDDAGKQIRLKPRLLVVPTAEAWTAKELLQSSGRPDSDFNGINPANGYVDWVSSPYITDTDSTYMVTDCPSGGVCVKRKKPFMKFDNNPSTLGIYTYVHMRLVFGYLNPRWAWGCRGA